MALISTPLMFAAVSYRSGSNSLARLLDNKADMGSANFSGHTPLHTAMIGLNQDACKILLERGANRDAKNLSGSTPLVYARRNNPEPEHQTQLENLQILVDHISSTPNQNKR